jgi:hypothetical protein
VCPAGSEVQTLLFPRPKFSVAEAKDWARRHGMKFGDVDVKDKYIHLRQADPSGFRRLRNVKFGDRLRAVVGWVKC